MSERFAVEFGAIEEVLHPMSQSFTVDAEGLFAFRCLRYFAWRCFSQASSWGLREFWPSGSAKTSLPGMCLSFARGLMRLVLGALGRVRGTL